MELKSIYVYPIKSLGEISLYSANVKKRGLEFDRRWMLIDENNRFITQREFPVMADLKCSLNNYVIDIISRTNPALKHSVPLQNTSNSPRVRVKIWNSTLKAAHLSDEHDEFFTKTIGTSCRLVFIDSKSKRYTNRSETGQSNAVGFADSFPYLILSQASLDDLNGRLSQPVEMLRFRPNIVIDGFEPYQEDTVKDIRIGNIRFRMIRQCPRCILTTVNRDTYIKGKEPLATLSKYRSVGNQVMFGMNAIALDYGEIHVTDPVEILSIQ